MMKNYTISVWIILITVLMSAVCLADNLVEDDFEYYINSEGTATISRWKGEEETLKIPKEINGYQVTAIGEKAFWHCDNLVCIEIPDCINVIENNPFLFSENLSRIVISPNNENYAVIDNVLFKKSTKAIVCYPNGLEGSEYAIPDGILSIGNDAFRFCKRLQSVKLPNSVLAIGDAAFNMCENLINIELGDSVVTIGENVFVGCKSLERIEFPRIVMSIGEGSLIDCESLRTIIIAPENESYMVLDNVLFTKDREVLICYPCGLDNTEYSIPGNTVSIGPLAFIYCTKLRKIGIPDSVTTIGDHAFCMCEELTSISLGKSVETIGDYAFLDCTKMETIEIPPTVTQIGEGVFNGCDAVTLVVERDSYASQYAEKHEIPYTYPDANNWLNN